MTATRLILSDCKSGRWIRCATEGQARRAALHLGWTDYTVSPGPRAEECGFDPFGQAARERRRHDEECVAEAEALLAESAMHPYLRRSIDPTASGRRMGLDELNHHRGD